MAPMAWHARLDPDGGGMTVTEILRWRLLHRAGLVKAPPVEEIERLQWDQEFFRLMLNRMVIGFFRYGSIRNPGVPPFRNVTSARDRLALYLEDGNREHLVDAANLCLCEWVRGALGVGEHPDPRWQPVDDGKHTPSI